MKINLSKIFDPAKFIMSAQSLGLDGARELGNWVSDLTDRIISALRNGLTFEDNFDAKIKNVLVKHNVVTNLGKPDPLKKVKHIIPTQTRPFLAGLKTFNWEYDAKGDLQVLATFDPASDSSVSLQLILLF